jgi:prophage maintenance system killer protein
MFLALNGWTLEPSPDEAVAMMLAVAAYDKRVSAERDRPLAGRDGRA